jgi:hypothetical protein
LLGQTTPFQWLLRVASTTLAHPCPRAVQVKFVRSDSLVKDDGLVDCMREKGRVIEQVREAMLEKSEW